MRLPRMQQLQEAATTHGARDREKGWCYLIEARYSELEPWRMNHPKGAGNTARLAWG